MLYLLRKNVQIMFESLSKSFREWLIRIGIGESTAIFIESITDFILILIIAVIAYYITKTIVRAVVYRIARKTTNNWDDILVEEKVFNSISMLVPGLIVLNTINATLIEHAGIIRLAERATLIYLAIIVVMIFFRFLNGFERIYNQKENADRHPIRGVIQVVKFFIFAFAVIFIISIFLKLKPASIIGGLGAGSAVAMLVFKDPILGFVGGIQLSLNNMVGIGDWISVPSRGADGDVEEIGLTTVKVRNFDKTIVTIPTYNLITDSFQNYRPMQELGVRRMKRSVNIDVSSIKFCTNEDLEKYSKITLIKDYIAEKQKEIDEYNAEKEVDTTQHINGRRQTNIGIFRAYLTAYIRSHEGISEDYTRMVRQQQPTSTGVPVEVYAFINTAVWVDYEAIQSDVFDHILAIIPFFDLRLYQLPIGYTDGN